jgi:glycosyltransferase involved in cell wall biosynthesis
LVRSSSRRTPRVTAIIPTFNWSTVLSCAIGSVLDQTFEDFELLVIGDGCTDDTAAVVATFAAQDQRVRWINLPLHGGSQVGPNNEGLRQAEGEFTAYLGHDDLWLPRHLALLVSAMSASPYGPGMAHGRVVLVHPGRQPFVFPHVSWDYRPGEWIPPTSTLHRTSALQRVGGWRAHGATGTLDPETDLCARLSTEFGPPRLVPHVTSVKLPAAYRENVYRERPNWEQSAWLTRIREAGDAEAALERLCGEPDTPVPDGDDPVALLEPVMRTSVTAEERYSVLRKFKGLDPP